MADTEGGFKTFHLGGHTHISWMHESEKQGLQWNNTFSKDGESELTEFQREI